MKSAPSHRGPPAEVRVDLATFWRIAFAAGDAGQDRRVFTSRLLDRMLDAAGAPDHHAERTLDVSPELGEAVDEAAAVTGRRASQVAERALRRALDAAGAP